MIPINKAPLFAFKNKDDINRSQTVGCYHCLAVFESKDIKEYTDEGETVLCPKCGIDSVLPEIDQDILKKINLFFFKKS
jgi:hypothetical protein